MSTPAEQEIRDSFEAWFRDASSKNLDAVMTKIASDVVSYEHDSQLQHRGVAALREICKVGFEAAHGDFRWDIPDLHVLVRGDIAVTWGLNHMQITPPGQPATSMWSRGTRVFQRMEGAWKMIHQHVSFPYDPETGRALTELAP